MFPKYSPSDISPDFHVGAAEAPQNALEEKGEFAPLTHADDLVEIELTPPEGSYFVHDPKRAGMPRALDPDKSLPLWKIVDLDTVLPDSKIEEALRAAGIVRVHRPKTGSLNVRGIKLMGMIEPIYVVRRDHVWYCILGWDLLREAQSILPSPRLFLVSILADMSIEDLKDYLIIEQVAVPLRHQMAGKDLNSLANTYLDVIMKNIDLFARLSVDQWARLMGRGLRWLRYRMAAAKDREDKHD